MSQVTPRLVGRPLPKVDASGKVTGRIRYTDDMSLPGMLHARIRRSDRPHARIAGVDTSRATVLPGVHAVLTGADLPAKYGILPVSQDERALAMDKVRYVGDPVAAVAAVDERTAAEALGLIEVTYEDLPAVLTVQDALAAGEDRRIHDRSERGNIQRSFAFDFGPVEAGFAAADIIRDDVFFYAGNTHLAMEPHCVIADATPDGRVTVWSSTQIPHYLHRALARVLGLPADRIRVIAAPVGGGFGGKSDMFSHEFVAAKLSMLTGRPVKAALTREESFYTHRGRHPVLMRFRLGATADGRITALESETFLDGGAFGGHGVASTLYTGALQTTTYQVPAYRFRGLRVFTNKPACGPKRGHGTVQPRFALEVQMDKLAVDLGISPAQLRRRQLVQENSRTVNWLRITSCGLAECLDKVVEASRFEDKWGTLPFGRGIGLACSAFVSGSAEAIYRDDDGPHTTVRLDVDRYGGVTAFCGEADIGQGSDTVLATCVAEVLGLSPDDIRLVTADTDLAPVALGSYSSRVTFMMGNAAIEAATRVRDILLRAAAGKLGVPAEALTIADGKISAGQAAISLAEAAAKAEADRGPISETGSYTPPDLAGPYRASGVGPSPAYSYSACAVEVTVDPETGILTVGKVWVAHDGGRVLNPALAEGQIEGSVYMGLGEALMEEQAFRKQGLHRGPSLLDYKSATTLEMPPVEVIMVQTTDPEGPFGAKEAGQGPLLPVPPAVANAIYDAVGVRIDETPVTPQKIIRALERLERGGEPRVGPGPVPDAPFREITRVDPPPGAPALGAAGDAALTGTEA